MRLLSFRGTDINCSPLLLAVLPAAYVMGRAGGLVSAFAALSVHEAAHAISASRAGCAVESIELQPFGFIANIDCKYASARDAAAIFAAGPTASLCLAAASALIARYYPLLISSGAGGAVAFLDDFSDKNLVLAAVNMLPALPLDGGRLIRALSGARSGRRGGRTLTSLLSAFGVAAGVLFICAFALLAMNGSLAPTLLLMGLFLAAAAIKELAGIRAPVLRRKSVRPGEALAVRQLAMSNTSTLASAISRLPAGAYAIVEVLDGSSRLVGTLDESQLLAASQSLGAAATLSMAVAYCRKKMV